MLHSDVHPGNWYVTADGRMGLCDWQCITHGGWARDIAYALSSHLTPEQRREWERDLVTRHGQRLAEAGIDAPDPDAAFLAYRQQMPHAMLMWLATLGRHALQAQLQPDDITLELIRRICTAADDLDTFGAIAEHDRRPAAVAV
jgi:thiamine kinase-like enzyme